MLDVEVNRLTVGDLIHLLDLRGGALTACDGRLQAIKNIQPKVPTAAQAK